MDFVSHTIGTSMSINCEGLGWRVWGGDGRNSYWSRKIVSKVHDPSKRESLDS